MNTGSYQLISSHICLLHPSPHFAFFEFQLQIYYNVLYFPTVLECVEWDFMFCVVFFHSFISICFGLDSFFWCVNKFTEFFLVIFYLWTHKRFCICIILVWICTMLFDSFLKFHIWWYVSDLICHISFLLEPLVHYSLLF